MSPRPMVSHGSVLMLTTVLTACSTNVTNNPLPDPIEASADVVVVGYEAFTMLPALGGEPARPMLLVDEPGSERMFVNDMWGPLYTVGYDGNVTRYLDIDDDAWGFPVDASGRERGFQSFAVHPQFAEPGTPGHGKLYTWSDTEDTAPEPDFTPGGGDDTHDTVLLEWTASDPSAATYDGGAPRVLLRLEQPFGNHNAGHVAFNPQAGVEDPDFGMLYVGVADGGSGGDPLDLAQDLGSPYGKILRIDPLGSDGPNGQYGIPGDNPFVGRGAETLGSIYALGLRNPQRFGWDPANGNLFVADIGQNAVEELSPVPAGGNLGWNVWEGSFRFVSRSGVDPRDPRSDPAYIYPVAEVDQVDPLFIGRVAVTGVVVPRSGAIPQLRDRVLFGDMVSGEIFHIPADDLPDGGQDAIRRVLLRDGGETRTLLGVMRARAEAEGATVPERTDLRFGTGPDERLFLLNKHDGVIRELIP
ncbi:MAG: PQQ-dependent sugar dehydrogenase [Gemmatimonadota bacterium]